MTAFHMFPATWCRHILYQNIYSSIIRSILGRQTVDVIDRFIKLLTYLYHLVIPCNFVQYMHAHTAFMDTCVSLNIKS